MKLLIDAGNSRIKWALVQQNQFIHQGHLRHEEVGQLAHLNQLGSIDEAWGSLVASDTLGLAIEKASPVSIRWAVSQLEQCGIRNHYPPAHGIDRWLAVLGARDYAKGHIVIASLGTALTVEALTEDNDCLGVIIAPGKALMLNSLVSGTARLAREEGHWTAFPCNTPDALTSGILDALVGAIARFRERFAKHVTCPVSGIEVILTGGNAATVEPFLSPPCRIIDNLVLQGLLKVSNDI